MVVVVGFAATVTSAGFFSFVLEELVVSGTAAGAGVVAAVVVGVAVVGFISAEGCGAIGGAAAAAAIGLGAVGSGTIGDVTGGAEIGDDGKVCSATAGMTVAITGGAGDIQPIRGAAVAGIGSLGQCPVSTAATKVCSPAERS